MNPKQYIAAFAAGITLALSACGGSKPTPAPDLIATSPKSSAQIVAPASQPAASAPVVPTEPDPTTPAPAAVAPVAPDSTASAPVAASAPAASEPVASAPTPASTPVVQLAIFGDDQAMGVGYTSMGMPQPVTPNAPTALQALLQKQFSDSGIQIADDATGGRASSLMNLLDGMDGGGSPFAQRLTSNPASIVVISYGLNDQYGGESASDFAGYLTQAVQTAQSAGRTVVLEEPSPTCDSDHPHLADYSAAIDAAGKALGVPVIAQYSVISDIPNWAQHMDGSCTVPDAYLDAIKAQQELAVIAPLVQKLIGS